VGFGSSSGTLATTMTSFFTSCGAGYSGSHIRFALDCACTDCGAGKYESLGICTDCVAGKFSASTKQSSSATCSPCAANTNSAAGASSCSCAAGYTGLDCTPCVAGQFKSTLGSGSCTSCARHTFTNTPGSAACTACTGNLASPLGGTTCSACVAGTYKTSSGSMACADCPQNAISPAGSTNISSCVCRVGFINGTNGCTRIPGTNTMCPGICRAPAGYAVTSSEVKNKLSDCKSETLQDSFRHVCLT
jgi:hypothetical protein